MRSLTVHRGLVAPLDRANVDTDAIIPKQFLKSIKRSGFGPNLFDEWRYLDRGEPGMDNSRRPPNPDFPLNQARYRGASVLLTRKNFGCGSSREHAPWALTDLGLRAIVSSEIADIFRGNSLKNGLLPIVLDEADVQDLMQRPDDELTIDVATRELRTPAGKVYAFPLDGFSQTCLLEGVDQLGWLLGRVPEIERYESQRHA